MTLAGMAISSVGLRPRHNDVSPSFLAILRRPSYVEVNVRRRVSSTAQSATEDVVVWERELRVAVGEATQYPEELFTQKTSRQQEVTPRFGGRLEKLGEVERVDVRRGRGEVVCDWRRTRTTSIGVTVND